MIIMAVIIIRIHAQDLKVTVKGNYEIKPFPKTKTRVVQTTEMKYQLTVSH